MANARISELIQRTPNGQEYFEVIIPPFTPGTNRKVLLSDLVTGLGLEPYTWPFPQFTTATSTTAYTGTPSPAITAYATGQKFQIKVHATSTGDATLALNGLAAKKWYKSPTAQATTGDLVINQIYIVGYDATLDGGAGGFLLVGSGGSSQTLYDTIQIVISGNGGVIPTGLQQGFPTVPFNCTIQSVELLGDVTGSIVVDIWKDTYANFPPTVADTITAAAKPTISSNIKYTDSTLTGWTTALTKGDILAYNVDSVTSFGSVTVILNVVRT